MIYTLVTIITFTSQPSVIPNVSKVKYKSALKCEQALNKYSNYFKQDINKNFVDINLNLKIAKNKGFLILKYTNIPIMTFSRCIKETSN